VSLSVCVCLSVCVSLSVCVPLSLHVSVCLRVCLSMCVSPSQVCRPKIANRLVNFSLFHCGGFFNLDWID